VGRDDARRVADALWQPTSFEMVHFVREARWRSDGAVFHHFLWTLVEGRMLAHLVGHVLVERGLGTPFAEAEAAADYLAGVLDAARRQNRWLGEQIFTCLDCLRGPCDPPPSRERAGAYRQGWRDQQRYPGFALHPEQRP
jgi:hypothetical protein